jgi:hypothetical protein
VFPAPVRQTNAVGSRYVRRKENTDIPVTLKDPDVTKASAGGAFHCVPALLHADNGQGPEIELERALKVHLIVELFDRRLRWHAVLELERANARVHLVGFAIH